MTITLNSLTTIGHPDPKILFRVYRNSWRIFTYHSKDHDYYKIAAEVIRKDKKYIMIIETYLQTLEIDANQGYH